MIPLPEHPPTLKERLAISLLTDSSAEAREQVRERCAQDPAWFINAFLFTYDPRNLHSDKPTDLPFELYPFQVDLVNWLENRFRQPENGLIEKSRDMGVSWVTLAWVLHKWLFTPGFSALLGSRKEDLVDNFTLDSHFGKLEYMLNRLPGWLKPRGFTIKQHRKKLRLVNPENNAIIIGESANAQFSRQGRYSTILMDEAAFWPDLSSAWRAASQASRCVIPLSTPNGQNYFYQLRMSKLMPVLTLHWSLHPHKDENWYAEQKASLMDEDLAQEVDISYNRSVRGRVYPGWDDVPKGVYPYESGYVLYVAWDFGIADDTAIVWFAYNPRTDKYRIVDCYSNYGKPIDFYVPFVLGYVPPECEQYEYTDDDREKIASHASWPNLSAIHFGDSAGKQRSQTTGTSVIDELKKYRIHVTTNDQARSFRERKARTELGLRLLEGVNLPECEMLDRAMSNARFPERNPDSRSTSEITNPIHDWTSHFRSAVEFFFTGIPNPVRRGRLAPTRSKRAYDDL